MDDTACATARPADPRVDWVAALVSALGPIIDPTTWLLLLFLLSRLPLLDAVGDAERDMAVWQSIRPVLLNTKSAWFKLSDTDASNSVLSEGGGSPKLPLSEFTRAERKKSSGFKTKSSAVDRPRERKEDNRTFFL